MILEWLPHEVRASLKRRRLGRAHQVNAQRHVPAAFCLCGRASLLWPGTHRAGLLCLPLASRKRS